MTFSHLLASQPSAGGSQAAAEGDMSAISANFAGVGFHLNQPPSGFSSERDLSPGFLELLAPLHRHFSPWQESLIAERKRALKRHSRETNPPIIIRARQSEMDGRSSCRNGVRTSATR